MHVAVSNRAAFWSARQAGFTIIECVLATAVLVIAGASMMGVIWGGRTRFQLSTRSLCSARLGEHLMEEIASRPYTGTGASRAAWCISDYNNFSENPGSLADAWGTRYAASDQGCKRSAKVTTASLTFPELGGYSVTGKTVVVHVDGSDDDAWELTRFIPEPNSP